MVKTDHFLLLIEFCLIAHVKRNFGIALWEVAERTFLPRFLCGVFKSTLTTFPLCAFWHFVKFFRLHFVA